MGLLIEVVCLVFAFLVFSWALLLHCKKPRKHLPELKSDSNVVSIHRGKDNKMQSNLQLFLDAEEALLNNENEKYLALRMQALEAARINLSGSQAQRRVS